MKMNNSNVGQSIYNLAIELFPICRSITGNGVRQTLDILKREIPEIKIYEVPSGTKAYDWEVPLEWNIKDAYIISPEGEKIVDFKENNLHVVSYSIPVDTEMSLNELDKYLYSLPDQPDAIPYVTSYYQKRWGFCLTHNQRKSLKSGTYRVKIDSSLKKGYLTYGEVIIPGDTPKEIFLSTYVCHPSMANNELSGPTVAVYLTKWIKQLKKRRYSYRIIFIPETIGSILYISKNIQALKSNVISGFNLTCCGDNRSYSFLPSRNGDTLADRISRHVLKYMAPECRYYEYLQRGSDERQYCSPGVDLPVVSIMRSKYHTYPEYHTSKDDLTFISPEGLEGTYDVIKKTITCIENDYIPEIVIPCEPFLSSHGLYPTLSTKNQTDTVQTLMDLIAYSDGEKDLLSIAEIIHVPMWELFDLVASLCEKGLMRIKHL